MAGNGLRAAGGVVKKTAKRAAGGGFSGAWSVRSTHMFSGSFS